MPLVDCWWTLQGCCYFLVDSYFFYCSLALTGAPGPSSPTASQWPEQTVEHQHCHGSSNRPPRGKSSTDLHCLHHTKNNATTKIGEYSPVDPSCTAGHTGRSLNGTHSFPKKCLRAHHLLAAGGWRWLASLVIGDWWLMAVGSGWRLMVPWGGPGQKKNSSLKDPLGSQQYHGGIT